MIKKCMLCTLCMYFPHSHLIAQYDTCNQYGHCTYSSTVIWAIPVALIGSALACIGFRWFHSPKKFTPTEENLHVMTLLPQNHSSSPEKPLLNLSTLKQHLKQNSVPSHTKKSVSTDIDIGQQTVKITAGTPHNQFALTHTAHVKTQPELVWIVSPGFMGHRPQKYSQEPAPETGLDQATSFIKAHIIHGPCIAFDYNDERRVFNFGQETDIASLKMVHDLVKSQDVILIGTCRGATTVLQFLTQLSPQAFAHIKAIILESPAVSLHTLATQVAHSYIDWLPKSPALLHTFFKFWFPNYDPYFPTFLDNLDRIPHDLPILIGHLENDRVISYSDIMTITKKLRATGHTQVYLTSVCDSTITHARLSKIPAFGQVVNAFLKKYTISHDEQLARLGEPSLKKAKIV